MSLRQRGRTHFHGNRPRRTVCSVVFSLFFFLPPIASSAAPGKCHSSQTQQMRRLRLMAVTSGAKRAEEAGEAHFDHVHLIYEFPPPNPPTHHHHRPQPRPRTRTPLRCRQVKDQRRRNQSEGPGRVRGSLLPFH